MAQHNQRLYGQRQQSQITRWHSTSELAEAMQPEAAQSERHLTVLLRGGLEFGDPFGELFREPIILSCFS